MGHMAKAGGCKKVKLPLQLTHFWVAKKKGQGFWIVQYFRELSQNSHIDKYSMKEITKCIGDIGRANTNIFTTLDMIFGFWQMKLDKKSQDLTAFIYPWEGPIPLNQVCLGAQQVFRGSWREYSGTFQMCWST